MRPVLIFIFLNIIATNVLASPYLINIKGQKEVTVTTHNIRLSDIANVESINDDIETQLAIQRLIIEIAPKPGEEKVITAARVLERLRESKVNLNKIGYELPRLIKVTRAKRMLKKDEVLNALEEYLIETNDELQIKTHDYRREIAISPKAKIVDITPIRSSKVGRKKFNLTISDNSDYKENIAVSAFVDVWKEVPVAISKISKGQLITEGDISYARLNIRELPRDYLNDVKKIIGFEAKAPIDSGSTFKISKIEVPTIIKNGDAVVIQYKSKNLIATATAKAIQSGGLGEEIKVRNVNSGKILSGEVLSEGLVEVK